MQSNLCITFFFSTLHITGKYKGLFPREYRKILTVRCTFTYCSECAGCVGTAGWAEPCTFWDSEEEEGGRERGREGMWGEKRNNSPFSLVRKKTVSSSSSKKRRNTEWARCGPTISEAAIQRKKIKMAWVGCKKKHQGINVWKCRRWCHD